MNPLRTVPAFLLLVLLSSVPVANSGDEESQVRGAPAAAPTGGPAATSPAPPAGEAPAAAQIAPGPTHADPADDAEAALGRLIDQVVELEVRLGREGGGPIGRSELAAIRVTAQDALVHAGRLRQERDARRWFEERGPVVDAPPPKGDAIVAAAPAAPRFDDGAIARLESQIQAAPFNEGKLAALRDGLGGRGLTAPQAARLLDLFSFSRDRVEVLVLLHPRLTDRDRFDSLLAALKFESDRQAVRDRLHLER